MRSGGVAKGLSRLLVVGLCLTAGCSALADSGATKAGNRTVVTLRMANGSAILDYVPAVQAFIEGVEHRSHGLLRIDVTNAVGNFEADFEPHIARAVASGEYDLAWLGTRAFDLMGVRSF